jgi:N-acetylglucosaminyldiphosphoundecaprenol N-acetyl-beta-D-mannosaminyltransferase
VVFVIDLGKRNVLGILVDAVDYDAATAKILAASRERRPFAVSALAVHGVMTGVQDPAHGYRLNTFDLLTADGQPVRWALNLLHRTALPDRVYGPRLMLRLCRSAAEEGLPIYLYGSRPEVLEKLVDSLLDRFPGLIIAGTEPSRFSRTTAGEKEEIATRIRESGASIVFVGLGCPRQEVFAYEYRDAVGVPLVAVGAAFEYHAGIRREPPKLIQRWGLQWSHRLLDDPSRLWKRYTLVSGRYLWLLGLHLLRIRETDPSMFPPPAGEILYG